MFTITQRVRERVLELAVSDPRGVARAVAGSLALDEGDRWSELDLTLAVADSSTMLEVLGARPVSERAGDVTGARRTAAHAWMCH